MKKKMKSVVLTFTACMAIGSALTACGNSAAPGAQAPAKSTEAPSASPSSQSAAASEKPAGGPITINQDIPDTTIRSTGPNGEAAVSAKTLKLTEEDIAKIKAGKYTAAIVMHFAGNDWSTTQVKGLKATFEKMGIEVVAVTDAQFKPEKQVSDLETVLAKKPDLIMSIPADPVSTAEAYKKAAAAGVKLVFMDNVPNGMVHGKDYVSVVSADNYGNGAAAAEVMGEKLGGKGKVGVVFHDADFFVTKQRTEAFEATLKEKFPNIEIVARGGIVNPNDGFEVASGMLTKNPDLDGIFGIWDVPAEGIVAAADAAGRKDLVITTTDLGENAALNIAKGGLIKGLGAQYPYDQGIAEAILAGYALLGKEAPAYVAVPALKVTRENVVDSWKAVFHVEAPQTIKDAIKK